MLSKQEYDYTGKLCLASIFHGYIKENAVYFEFVQLCHKFEYFHYKEPITEFLTTQKLNMLKITQFLRFNYYFSIVCSKSMIYMSK